MYPRLNHITRLHIKNFSNIDFMSMYLYWNKIVIGNHVSFCPLPANALKTSLLCSLDFIGFFLKITLQKSCDPVLDQS